MALGDGLDKVEAGSNVDIASQIGKTPKQTPHLGDEEGSWGVGIGGHYPPAAPKPPVAKPILNSKGCAQAHIDEEHRIAKSFRGKK